MQKVIKCKRSNEKAAFLRKTSIWLHSGCTFKNREHQEKHDFPCSLQHFCCRLGSSPLFSKSAFGPQNGPKMVPGGDLFPPSMAGTDWPGALLGASWAPFGPTGRPRTLQESPEAPQEVQQHHFWDAKWSPKSSQHNKKQDATKPRLDQTGQATTREDRTKQDKTRQDKTRQKKKILDSTRHDKTEHKTQDNRHNPQPNEKARRNARSG